MIVHETCRFCAFIIAQKKNTCLSIDAHVFDRIGNEVEPGLQSKADIKTEWLVMKVSGGGLFYYRRTRLFLILGSNNKFWNGLSLLLDSMLNVECLSYCRSNAVPRGLQG